MQAELGTTIGKQSVVGPNSANARCTAYCATRILTATAVTAMTVTEAAVTAAVAAATAATPVTLRLRHLILSRPFKSSLSYCAFRTRFHLPATPSHPFVFFAYRVPRRKSVPRTLSDSLPKETRTGVPVRQCKQERIEIQIGATCTKLDGQYSRTDSRS